jgi:CHASE3 domain sensor protein
MNAMQKKIALVMVSSFVLSILIFISVAWLANHNLQSLISKNEWVNHTHEVIYTAEKTISLLKDAETGQRGYLITQKEEFLAPYFTILRLVYRLNNPKIN